jgi:hypothetical protein
MCPFLHDTHLSFRFHPPLKTSSNGGSPAKGIFFQQKVVVWNKGRLRCNRKPTKNVGDGQTDQKYFGDGQTSRVFVHHRGAARRCTGDYRVKLRDSVDTSRSMIFFFYLGALRIFLG